MPVTESNRALHLCTMRVCGSNLSLVHRIRDLYQLLKEMSAVTRATSSHCVCPSVDASVLMRLADRQALDVFAIGQLQAHKYSSGVNGEQGIGAVASFVDHPLHPVQPAARRTLESSLVSSNGLLRMCAPQCSFHVPVETKCKWPIHSTDNSAPKSVQCSKFLAPVWWPSK